MADPLKNKTFLRLKEEWLSQYHGPSLVREREWLDRLIDADFTDEVEEEIQKERELTK